MKRALMLMLASQLVACPPKKPEDTARDVARERAGDKSEPVALIEGQPLTLAEFERRIDQMPLEARPRFASPEGRKALLESQVQFEILALRAAQKGYANHPVVREAMKDALAGELLEEKIAARANVSKIDGDAIRAYYEANREAFREPRRREVVAIFQDTRRDAERLRDTLEKIPYESEKQRVYTFRSFADRNAIWPEFKKKGGAIGFLDDPTDPKAKPSEFGELAGPAFALSAVGEMSDVLPYKDTFVVLMFIAEQAEHVRELSQVEDEIREKLQGAARASARAEIETELRTKATVEVHQNVVDKIGPPKPKPVMSEEMLDAFGQMLGYESAASK